MEMVIITYIIALIVKDIVVWIIIEKKIHRHSWYPWATFIAPGIGAILIYVILYLITKLVSPNLITVLLIFVLTFFIFLNVYSFFVGFFGGYDKNTIQEFEKSAYMTTGPAGFFSRLLFKSANAGTRISPLHNRFPITIYEDAYIEANELNSFKKKLY